MTNFFKTKDGSWICIVQRQGDVDWVPMCKVIGREDLMEDARFTSSKSRRQNGAELVDIIDQGFGNYTKQQRRRHDLPVSCVPRPVSRRR